MAEWPGTPRFDEGTELWTYQAALDARIYPRETVEPPRGKALSAAALLDACWPSGKGMVATEDVERYGRNLWPDLTRPRLKVVLLEGLQGGQWCVWKCGSDEVFYAAEDPLGGVRVGPDWVLVAPQSKTAGDLGGIRPGRGPQPSSHTGTPREVLVKIWEELGGYKEVAFSELTIAATDRDTLDNTLLATWADRPTAAQVHASIRAAGQRDVDGKTETIDLKFEGRFEELRAMLSPVWPFARQGDLDVTVGVRLSFDPPIPMGDGALETYRTALMNANQGTVEVRAVPARARKSESA